mmetsp:Transcript_21034/g.67762  ORF Transcript_21034/g.67762 Transcript_21034/m.67762 type:complete len:236 (-) Transcript_21034:243-950(-)
MAATSSSRAIASPSSSRRSTSARARSSGIATGSESGSRRSTAGSTSEGWLVAAMTTTCAWAAARVAGESIPSHSARNWARSAAVASCSEAPRLPPCEKMQSISSMKRMLGASLCASVKYASASLFDSPYHFEKSRAGLRHRKAKSASCAMARASIVLPVPGGPWSRMPFGGRSSLEAAKSRGCCSGSSSADRSWRACSSRPPTWSKEQPAPEGATRSEATSSSYSVRLSLDFCCR